MGSMRGVVFLLILLSLCAPVNGQSEQRKSRKRDVVEAPKEGKAKSGKAVAKELRAEWELAIRDLNATPVASPYAVSYYTLPKHWAFVDQLRRTSAG